MAFSKKQRQQIYDKIKVRASDPTRAYDEDNDTCRYRHPETGLPCFIGVLIPDAKYKEDFEERGAPDVEIIQALSIKNGCRAIDGQFLRELQEIHDHEDPENWFSALHDFAISYGLKP